MKANLHLNNTLEAKVFTKGTIKLPSILRNELDIHDGDKILFMKRNNTWMVTTHLKNILESQKYIQSLKMSNTSIVDDLIKERRTEVDLEFKK